MKQIEIRLESKELLGFSQVERVSPGSSSAEPASLGRVLSKAGEVMGVPAALDPSIDGAKVAGS
jgi:hypothetical protein